MKKRIKSLVVSQHINDTVRMTYASGSDQCKSNGYTIKVIVFQPEEGDTHISGAWEICSDDSNCYGEGSLTFDLERKCIDYDGCYDLSHKICDLMTRLQYDMTEVDSRLF